MCVYIYTYIYIWSITQAIKNSEIMSFAATWMDLEMTTLGEVSQTKTNILWYHFYVEPKKKWYKETYFKKTETDSQT